MALVRRITAVLSSALLLQLSLPGAGSLCSARSSGGDGAAGNSDGRMTAMMHGAGMGATASTVTDLPSNAPQHPTGCGDHGPAAPCGASGTPGMCASMTACASSLSAANSPTPLDDALVPAGAIRATQQTLDAGPAFAPELPPPRA